MTRTRTCEVLVVGSGAGGAPTAAVLAEAGFDVIIVEEGPWVPQGANVPFSIEQMERQYRSAGVTGAIGRPSISYAEGRCAGGGTEINSGLYRRPTEATLVDWRDRFGVRDYEMSDLAAIFDEVESELEVQHTTGPSHPASDRLALGADRLGWAQVAAPRWMSYDGGRLRRRSMTETYLPRAMAAGAQLLCDHRVDRLKLSGRRAVRATGTDGRGAPVEYAFDHVVVCGGAIQTPALLQRSGFRKDIGAGLAVHPMVKLAAKFADQVNVPDDVPVHQIMEFAPDLSIGGSASHPGLVALSLADNWSLNRQAVTDWQSMAVYYAAIKSEGRGRVTALPGLRDPLVTYRLTGRDRALLSQGLSRLGLLLLKADAEAIFPSVAGAPIIRSQADLGRAAKTFKAAAASVMTVHICSTVPMGETPGTPVDSYGRLKAAENVYVNDASLLPDAPGVNPQALISATALRNARRFVGTQR